MASPFDTALDTLFRTLSNREIAQRLTSAPRSSREWKSTMRSVQRWRRGILGTGGQARRPSRAARERLVAPIPVEQARPPAEAPRVREAPLVVRADFEVMYGLQSQGMRYDRQVVIDADALAAFHQQYGPAYDSTEFQQLALNTYMGGDVGLTTGPGTVIYPFEGES